MAENVNVEKNRIAADIASFLDKLEETFRVYDVDEEIREICRHHCSDAFEKGWLGKTLFDAQEKQSKQNIPLIR